jgi:hypothetical protein
MMVFLKNIWNIDFISDARGIFASSGEDLLEFPPEFNCSKLLGSVLLTQACHDNRARTDAAESIVAFKLEHFQQLTPA